MVSSFPSMFHFAFLAAGALLLGDLEPCRDAWTRYEALDLFGALQAADRALVGGTSRPLECVEVRGLALLILGRSDEARRSFSELFEREPERAVVDPTLSPVMRTFIESVREMARPLSAHVEASWMSADDLRIDVSLEGGLRDAATVRLSIPSLGVESADNRTADLRGRNATVTLRIAPDVRSSSARVVGEVVDRVGRGILKFAMGVALPPRPTLNVVLASTTEDGGMAWPWWVAIGVAVVGASVTGMWLAAPGAPDTTGTQGRVRVEP